MFKKFSFFFYQILKIFDNILTYSINKSFLSWFKEFLIEDSYKKIIINQKQTIFFIPNNLTRWRVDTFFTKEPETLEWIQTFDKTKPIIFWDIGSNIGLYSIYAATIHSNCAVISFEPSSNNLRVLARNIAINNLEERISIFSNPLSDKNERFLMMQDTEFREGAALNSYGEKFNFEGKNQNYNMKYKLLGKSLKHILKNKILDIPDYIKIDVDGIEHLILEGAGEFLREKKIKSISVEINENFKTQFDNIVNIMEINNFKFSQKRQNEELKNSGGPFSKSFNYIFSKW